MRTVSALALVIAAAASGCYRAHEAGDTLDGPDGGRLDAGPRDAGRDGGRDAGRDASLLPIDAFVPRDADLDAPRDAAPDAPRDAAPDAPRDADRDAGIDAPLLPVDAGPVDAGLCPVGVICDFLELRAARRHACALRESGGIACWGGNATLQLGGSTPGATSATPVDVVGVTDAIAVAPGEQHTCALRAARTVLCWGANQVAQLGDGSMDHVTRCRGADCTSTPQPVSGLTDVVQVAAGAAHTCALRTGGSVACWGANDAGKLGDGIGDHGVVCRNGTSTIDCSFVPVEVSGVADAVELSVGGGHTCIRRRSGRVSCWGENYAGQIGDGSMSARSTPVDVSMLTDAVAIAAGRAHTCAMRRSGEVVCWGRNVDGQLGDGTVRDRSVPGPVRMLASATSISAGGFHACALHASRRASCWGGTEPGAMLTMPVDTGLADVVSIWGGFYYTCAVLRGGEVLCWGDNTFEQLGPFAR